MKVDVITMHAVNNYGSVLQAFATLEFFRQHGCEAILINALLPIINRTGVFFRHYHEDLLIGKERCNAIVVTGEGTARNTSTDKIKLFRRVLGNYPLFVGAGMTEDTCREQITIADGAIVGSWFKENVMI